MPKNLSPYQIAKICKREKISLKEFYKRNFEEIFGETEKEKNTVKEIKEEKIRNKLEFFF